ncbi:TIR domain-containing protein [Umezawaea endophytica]|uniref:TIR domain-containing protein n=1 Tax=Umezawaea endophytica TaxID=1654476 RepID=A0A9X3AKK8_9PSEU|nr:TIR domain-containing protein [Umezawaea endophytica]MCS7483030.1 TIR domain-containing protein [Umezawaea endophytica]
MEALKVFISHSFDNELEFENVVDWLEHLGVPYWRPTEMKSGGSLREQLRSAVQLCSVCVFVATRKSVESSWCGAELGAFWGAGIPIIVYVADPQMSDDLLPQILQGDLWERRLSRVAFRAAELVKQAQVADEGAGLSPTARISSMTVQQFQKFVVGAFSLVEAQVGNESGSRGDDRDLTSIASDVAGRILRGAEVTSRISEGESEDWKRRVLWVDDRPLNNRHERGAFESFGIEFALASSTDEAVEVLEGERFAAVISDMGRPESPRAGYELLEKIRDRGNVTPFFLYSGSDSPRHRREALDRGAQGVTNVADELIDMVTAALRELD